MNETAQIIEPKISTLVAELRVIKIGNKQMTISVFKQLYEENCWNDQYEIIYPVWGKVKKDEIEWIVFQNGGDLRKVKIPELPRILSFKYWFAYVIKSNTISEGFNEYIFENIKNGRINLELKKRDYCDSWYSLLKKEVFKDEKIRKNVETYHSLWHDIHWYSHSSYRRDLRTKDEDFNHIIENVIDKEDGQYLKDGYLNYKTPLDAKVKMIEKLKQSEQLFIAV